MEKKKAVRIINRTLSFLKKDPSDRSERMCSAVIAELSLLKESPFEWLVPSPPKYVSVPLKRFEKTTLEKEMDIMYKCSRPRDIFDDIYSTAQEAMQEHVWPYIQVETDLISPQIYKVAMYEIPIVPARKS